MEGQETALSIKTLEGVELKIGKMSSNGYFNVFCNFNPMRKLNLIRRFNNSGYFKVVGVFDYQNETGGLSLKVNETIDYATVIKKIEIIFITEIS